MGNCTPDTGISQVWRLGSMNMCLQGTLPVPEDSTWSLANQRHLLLMTESILVEGINRVP